MTVSIRHSLNGYTINSRYYECSCGATNNAKIKSTLTVDGVSKDKLTVGFEAYEKYYTDTSDTYLGVGDPFGGR